MPQPARVTGFDRQIVLIGMMAVGKTTLGRMLAKQLGWEFWDNDEALGEATGQTAAEVQLSQGQVGLHRLENRLLRRALAVRTPTVFAAAASVVLKPEIVSRALTIWLRASAAAEAANLARSGQRHRPLPATPAGFLSHMMAEREPRYEQIARLTVDVASTPDETLERLLAALPRELKSPTA